MQSLYSKILLFLFQIPLILSAQECDLSIKGRITDNGTGEPLESVAVILQEKQYAIVTDSRGTFRIDNLCHGDYHLIFSHLGCEPKQISAHIHNDTLLNIELDHSIHIIETVEITGHTDPSNQKEEHIHEQEIVDKANDDLSEVLASVSGVSLMKNGGISKPVVHGLYGNRLSILNNGIPQAGQQWGNDHSPEIDPLSANQISVIKGSAALEYLGANLGSVILVSPQAIKREEHIHGKAVYFFESNGREHNLHGQLQQYSPKLAWKLSATAKKKGDQQSPNYFLNNTGSEEINLSLQLERDRKDKWYNSLYISTFNTTLGVLRGGHVSNKTDLENAFSKPEPYYTEENFSYAIDAPKQSVHHHLAKWQTKKIIDSTRSCLFTSAAQANFRNEFDIRRNGRSETPVLSLRQFTFFNEIKYQQRWGNEKRLKTGIQSNIIDNTNIPGTGVKALIPNYISYQFGTFITFNRQFNKHAIELGTRFDHIYQNVATTSTGYPRVHLRYENNYPIGIGSFLWKTQLSNKMALSAGLAYSMRNPAINELYSQGLHQGVSGIESGDINLDPEKSIKGSLSYDLQLNDKLVLSTFFYLQQFQNYIYLQPTDEVRLTIRGAYPVFQYEQTNAQISGMDWSINYELMKELHAELKYNFIHGLDKTNNLGLVYIPSNNFQGNLSYEKANPVKIGKRKLYQLKMEWNNKSVFQQNNISQTQDFAPTPPAYYLMGAKLSGEIQASRYRWRIVLKGENLLNVVYRDYLNRLRYFSDDLGRTISLGVILKF